MSKIITSNENYHLKIGPERKGYEIVNRLTGVVEATLDTLPDAYHALAHLNMAMVKRPWEWIEQEIDDGGLDFDLN